MEVKDHWEKVYSTKAATEVSWFQEHAALGWHWPQLRLGLVLGQARYSGWRPIFWK